MTMKIKRTLVALCALIGLGSMNAYSQTREVSCGGHLIRVGGAHEAKAFQQYINYAAKDRFVPAMKELRSIGKGVFIEMSPNNFQLPEVIYNTNAKADVDARRRLQYTRALIGEGLASVDDFVVCTPGFKGYRLEYAMMLAQFAGEELPLMLIDLGADPKLKANEIAPFLYAVLLPPAAASRIFQRVITRHPDLFDEIPPEEQALFAAELSNPYRGQLDLAKQAIAAGMNPNLRTRSRQDHDDLFYTWLDMSRSFDYTPLIDHLVALGATANPGVREEVDLCRAVIRDEHAELAALLTKGVARGWLPDLPCFPFQHVTIHAKAEALRLLLAANYADERPDSRDIGEFGNATVSVAIRHWIANPASMPKNAVEALSTWLDFGAATSSQDGMTWRNAIAGANKDGAPRHLRRIDRWLSRQGVAKTDFIKRNKAFLADQYPQEKKQSGGFFSDLLTAGFMAVGAAAVVKSDPAQVSQVLNTFIETQAVAESLASGNLDASDRMLLEMTMNRSLSTPQFPTLQNSNRSTPAVECSLQVGGPSLIPLPATGRAFDEPEFGLSFVGVSNCPHSVAFTVRINYSETDYQGGVHQRIRRINDAAPSQRQGTRTTVLGSAQRFEVRDELTRIKGAFRPAITGTAVEYCQCSEAPTEARHSIGSQ